jgi:uncharacterized membrane protein YdbT with pleckstrin-like domain
MVLALSSCAGKGFMKQKYTHFAHSNKHSQNTSVASFKKETPDKPPGEVSNIIADKHEVVVLQRENETKEEDIPVIASFHQEKKKIVAKVPVTEQRFPVHAEYRITQQNKTQNSGSPRFHHMTPWEEFVLAFCIIFVFLILPAAFITGIVWMFFNFWLGALIAGSAALIFGTIVLIAANS